MQAYVVEDNTDPCSSNGGGTRVLHVDADVYGDRFQNRRAAVSPTQVINVGVIERLVVRQEVQAGTTQRDTKVIVVLVIRGVSAHLETTKVHQEHTPLVDCALLHLDARNKNLGRANVQREC